jgi:hypothetical protein
VAQAEVTLRGLIAEANLQIELLKEFNALDIVRVKGVAEVTKDIGDQYAHLAGAALAGMNTLAADVFNTTS